MLSKELRECIEEDWRLNVYNADNLNEEIDENTTRFDAELEHYSKAGEDFIVNVIFDGTDEDFVAQFDGYVDDFNPEEYANMWYGQNRGEPSSLETLLDDAKDMEDYMLECVQKYKDKLDKLEAIPTRDDIIGWLSEHDEPYTDFYTHFNAINEDGEFMEEVIDGIDIDDIKEWIAEHDQLAEDYKQHFGIKDRMYTVEVRDTDIAIEYFDDKDEAIRYCKNHPKADVVFEYETDLDGNLGDCVGDVYIDEHKKEYEQYKLRWMLEHGYTLTDLIKELDDYGCNHETAERFKMFENYGFKHEIWACREEWEDNELKAEE